MGHPNHIGQIRDKKKKKKLFSHTKKVIISVFPYKTLKTEGCICSMYLLNTN